MFDEEKMLTCLWKFLFIPAHEMAWWHFCWIWQGIGMAKKNSVHIVVNVMFRDDHSRN